MLGMLLGAALVQTALPPTACSNRICKRAGENGLILFDGAIAVPSSSKAPLIYLEQRGISVVAATYVVATPGGRSGTCDVMVSANAAEEFREPAANFFESMGYGEVEVLPPLGRNMWWRTASRNDPRLGHIKLTYYSLLKRGQNYRVTKTCRAEDRTRSSVERADNELYIWISAGD